MNAYWAMKFYIHVHVQQQYDRWKHAVHWLADSFVAELLASVVLGMQRPVLAVLPLVELLRLQALDEAVHVDAHHVAATVALWRHKTKIHVSTINAHDEWILWNSSKPISLWSKRGLQCAVFIMTTCTNLQASLSILDPALWRKVCRLGTVVASIEAWVVAEWKRDDELSRVLNDLQQHTRIQFGRDTNDDNRMYLFVALVINKVSVYRGYYFVEWNRILFQIQWRDYWHLVSQKCLTFLITRWEIA